jgi:hypothetical protein
MTTNHVLLSEYCVCACHSRNLQEVLVPHTNPCCRQCPYCEQPVVSQVMEGHFFTCWARPKRESVER